MIEYFSIMHYYNYSLQILYVLLEAYNLEC